MDQMTECDFFNGTVGSLILHHKFQFKRYSNGDLATYQDLNTIFDNYQVFMDQIDNASYVLGDSYSFFSDLFLRKIVQMADIVQYVPEEFKKEYIALMSTAKRQLNSYPEDFGWKYIESHLELLEESGRDTSAVCWDIIEENVDSISKQTITHLLKNHPSNIIYDFKRFKNRILEDGSILDMLLSTEVFDKVKDYHLEQYLEVISSLYDAKSIHGGESFSILVDYVLRDATERVRTIESEGFPLFREPKLEFDFLKKVGCEALGDIAYTLGREEELTKDYLSREGHVIERAVDISSDFYQIVKDCGWFPATISMSHTSIGDETKSCFELYDGKSSFTDELLETENSGYLTNSRRNFIDLEMMFKSSLILSISKSENCDKMYDAFRYMAGCFHNVYADNLFRDEIVCMYDECQRILSGDNGFIERYGLAMFINSMTEKLLRTVVQIHKPEKHLELTLSRLFQDSDVLNILGKDQARSIQYFLSRYNEDGHDLRNDLAHWQNIQMEAVNEFLVCNLLFCFNSILISTTLFLENLLNKSKTE